LSLSNKRLHTERRHTLLFVYQTLLPSGEAQPLDKFRTPASDIRKFSGSPQPLHLPKLIKIDYTMIFKLEMGFDKEDERYDKSAGTLFGYSCNRPHRPR
ncbi:MAG: hypothetical protein LW834_14585, partial [Cyanobium sp. 49614_E6]|nr:hypothetical protein [Cyanobium sp. 49614_E6]